jgi:acyl-CoA dehydrogenase
MTREDHAMDFTIDHTQEEIYRFGRRLAEKFDREYWLERIDERRFPLELWAELGATGHLGILVPESEGGAGLGLTEMALLTEGLALGGFPLLTLITGPGLALPAIARHGSDRARSEILPALLSGRSVMPFAISESAVGSNLMKLRASAEPEGNHFILSGTKNFTSGANVADHVIVLARTPSPTASDPDRSGFTLLLVPTDAEGFSLSVDETRIPMPEEQCTLCFDRVVLGRDDVVGEPGGPLAVLAPALVNERVVTAALACGLGQYALEKATEYVSQRSVFGQPLGAHQGVQHPLAKARTRIELARLMIRNAAWLADTGGRADGAANMATWAAGEAGLEATDAALQAVGGYGYTRDAEVFTSYQLARLLRSAPVNAESALNAIGELVLHLPRSY